MVGLNVITPSSFVIERGAAYRLLGSMFLYPTPERLVEIQQASHTILHHGGFAKLRASEDFETLMRSYVKAVEHMPSSCLNEYHRLFHIKPAAPLYASYYLDPSGFNRAWILVNLEQLYAQSGLSFSPEFNDPPDHLGTLLEFMSFLCSMQADEASDHQALRQQHDFIQSNLMSWIPDFVAKVRSAVPSSPFEELVTTLEGFVEEDYLRLQEL